MAAEAWIVLAIISLAFVAMAMEWASPPAAMLGSLVLLLALGTLSPAEAFAGFSNPAPITVAALYVVARAVDQSGVLHLLVGAAIGGDGGPRRALLRLLLPAAGASAFLNNTPVVAMLLPRVLHWSEHRGRHASALLMPLSFAVILGGVVTTIGTSTNLVVSGLLQAHGYPAFGLFEITPIGLPVAAAGLVVLVVAAPRLLPPRKAPRERLIPEAREFLVRMEVVPGGALAGRTVAEAGLRRLRSSYLIEVERGDQRISPVEPSLRLLGGDRLDFVGRAADVADLRTRDGLRPLEAASLAELPGPESAFFEAVIGAPSPLVGRTPRDVGFRDRYQAAIVGIQRQGQRVAAGLGETRLEVGDALLLLADRGFAERWRDRSDFLLVVGVEEEAPAARARSSWLVLGVLLAVVAASGTGLLPILQTSLLAALVLVASRVLSAREARDSVDLDVIIVIAASFGLGAAIERSGLAEVLGHGIVNAAGGAGRTAVLAAVVLATMALTELISNNAAAAVVFPIAIVAAGGDPAEQRAFALAVAVAASASFLTPVGYQTNTMVFGPGGYRFGDYARLGAPLTAVVFAVILLVV